MKVRFLRHYEAYKDRASEWSNRTPESGIPNASRLFFQESMRSMRMTASIFPSSRSLASALVRTVDFRHARTVVELGPGTGPITREILKRLHPDAKLFALEINPTFIDHLRATCVDPRLNVVRGSATELQSLLAPHGIQSVDAVISSLPFTGMDQSTRIAILRQVGGCLAPHGAMTQCQYEIAKLRPGGFNEERFLRGFFSHVGVRRVLLNLPPTLVFTCRGWR